MGKLPADPATDRGVARVACQPVFLHAIRHGLLATRATPICPTKMDYTLRIVDRHRVGVDLYYDTLYTRGPG